MENLNDKIRLAELYMKALSLEKSSLYTTAGVQTGIESRDRFILSHSIRAEIESNLLELVKAFKEVK